MNNTNQLNTSYVPYSLGDNPFSFTIEGYESDGYGSGEYEYTVADNEDLINGTPVDGGDAGN